MCKVQVEAYSGKRYTYECDIPGIKIGDTVLCDSINGPFLGTIVALDAGDYDGPCRRVLKIVEPG